MHAILKGRIATVQERGSRSATASGCTPQELRLLAVWPLSLAAYRGDVLKTARSGRVSAAPTILSWSERVFVPPTGCRLHAPRGAGLLEGENLCFGPALVAQPLRRDLERVGTRVCVPVSPHRVFDSPRFPVTHPLTAFIFLSRRRARQKPFDVGRVVPRLNVSRVSFACAGR